MDTAIDAQMRLGPSLSEDTRQRNAVLGGVQQRERSCNQQNEHKKAEKEKCPRPARDSACCQSISAQDRAMPIPAYESCKIFKGRRDRPS